MLSQYDFNILMNLYTENNTVMSFFDVHYLTKVAYHRELKESYTEKLLKRWVEYGILSVPNRLHLDIKKCNFHLTEKGLAFYEAERQAKYYGTSEEKYLHEGYAGY